MSSLPVLILTGYLGSGKTTVLNHFLATGGARIGVIINDFGDVNVDAALVAGHVHMSIGFVVMHDASHSAISSNPLVNFALSWMWNTLSCWDYRLWHKHHVFRHHSFTGDTERDPDTVHLTPFLRKHLHEAASAPSPSPAPLP